MREDPSIVICGGHTGGHFFPAISFARCFLRQSPQANIHILLSRIPEFAQSIVSEGAFKFHIIDFPPFPKIFSLKFVSFLIKYAFAFVKTLRLYAKIRPALIAGFGSYSSIPGVLTGAVLGVPILLHEQNAAVGRANQFLVPWSRKTAISFPETHGRIPEPKKIYAGYPLREEFLSSDVSVSPTKKFTILVFGGSQGAKRINEVFLDTIRLLYAEEKMYIAVIHIVGSDDPVTINSEYKKMNLTARVEKFSNRMKENLSEADLVICRAGAGTIFELAALGKPSILIPYPHAYGHQKMNAEALVVSGAARVIYDEQLTDRALFKEIKNLYENRNQLDWMSLKIRRFSSSNPAKKLVDTALELIWAKN